MPPCRFCKILLLPLLAVLVLGRPARAAETPHFAALKISLWPEYDRPAVLVMYDIALPESTDLPVTLDIRIPARAGEPFAVAFQEPSGNLVNADYRYSASGEWGVVSVNAMMPNLHIEYYDPSLVKEGSERRFVFHWPGDFAVDAVSLVIQQPATATGMKITPAMGDGAVESDGLTYYRAQIGALTAGQTFDVSVVYTKNDDILSKEKLAPHDVLPAEAPAKGEVTVRKVLPWVLTTLGVVLIVIGLVWYWISRQTTPEPAPRRRSRSRKRQPMPPEALAGDAEADAVRYCPQCGARAQPGDRFCRVCGAKLR